MRKNSMIILGCALVLAVGSRRPAVGRSCRRRRSPGWAPTSRRWAPRRPATPTAPSRPGTAASPPRPPATSRDTHYVDPFAGDKVLFTITAANMDQYADKLTPGPAGALQDLPDTYKMNVYPTRRSASYPAADLRQDQGDRRHRAAGRERLRRHRRGQRHPVPDPQAGRRGDLEPPAALPRATAPRGTSRRRRRPAAATTRWSSSTTSSTCCTAWTGMTEADLNNKILFFKQEVMAPARLAGGILLVARDPEPGQGAPQRLALQPGPAPRPPRPQRGLRQPGHRLRRHAHLRPVRHVQRRGRPLRLEAGRQEGDLRPLQLLQAAGPVGEVQGHPDPAAHQPGLSRATSCTGSGSSTRPSRRARATSTSGAPSTSTRTAGRSSRSTSTTTATSCGGCPRATSSTTTTCPALDHARGPHRPAGRPLPGHRPRQREPAVRLRHQAHARGLHAGGAAPRGHALDARASPTAAGPESGPVVPCRRSETEMDTPSAERRPEAELRHSQPFSAGLPSAIASGRGGRGRDRGGSRRARRRAAGRLRARAGDHRAAGRAVAAARRRGRRRTAGGRRRARPHPARRTTPARPGARPRCRRGRPSPASSSTTASSAGRSATTR